MSETTADSREGGWVPETAGNDTGAAEVSLPESVVAPLIGAGANVYILTNELTQTMREKLGIIDWPSMHDTLNSRYAKLLAGGMLASLACIVFWKIVKRLSSAAKPKPPPTPREGSQWATAKTFELTPLSERMEGEGGDPFPLHALPKIQLRIADSSLSHGPQHAGATKGMDGGPVLYCKARDAATRNRHTRHLQQSQGERAAGGEEADPDECVCPSEPCDSPAAPRPRLLYSVRESRLVQRAMDMSDPRLVNLLTYTSCPSQLCPSAVVASPQTHGLCSPYALPGCGGRGLSECASSPCDPHCEPVFMTPVCRSPFAGDRASCCGGASQSLRSEQESGLSENASCQGLGLEPDSEARGRSGDEESGARSRGTDGVPGEEDLDYKDARLGGTARSQSGNTPLTHTQGVPTRVASSPVTPSLCTNAPLRSNHMHFHTPTSFGAYPAGFGSSQPMVYQSPQSAMFQMSPDGACPPSPYQAAHLHCQAPLSVYGNRSQMAPPLFQPMPCHHEQQQQHATRMQQQQQQPVVQHPSESSVSQTSAEVCSSQEARQCEGSQRAQPPDVVPQDGALVQKQQQQQCSGRDACPHASPPLAMVDSQYFSRARARALADQAQADYPWRGPGGFHSFRPTSVYGMGYQPNHPGAFFPPAQHPWASPNLAMFLPPGVFPSSPMGMFPSPHFPGHMMGGHGQHPFFFPHTHLPESKPMPFQSNFNLSNSNTHMFMRPPGPNPASMPPFLPESCRIRLIESDQSVSPDLINASGEAPAPCPSPKSVPAGAENMIGISGMREDTTPLLPSDSAPTQPCEGTSQAEPAGMEQPPAMLQTEVSALPEAAYFPEDGAAASLYYDDDTALVPADRDLQVKDFAEPGEDALNPSCGADNSTPCDGMETQL